MAGLCVWIGALSAVTYLNWSLPAIVLLLAMVFVVLELLLTPSRSWWGPEVSAAIKDGRLRSQRGELLLFVGIAVIPVPIAVTLILHSLGF